MTSHPGIRNVFFDVGGTLLDLDHAHLLDALSSGGEAERRVTPDALARGEDEARVWFIGEMRRGGAPADAWNEFFTRLLRGADVGEEAIPPLLKELWQRNVTGGLWHRPVPGAHAALARLKAAGLRLAVISNAEGRVAEDLAIAGLAPHFETIVDSHNVGVAKPDPRIFAIALERLEARAEESVYIGDLYRIDVLGARAAGMRAVLLDRFDHHADAPCTRITHLDELGAYLFTD
jgi:HAD superfamily hydrolase (TIGR01509 family)